MGSSRFRLIPLRVASALGAVAIVPCCLFARPDIALYAKLLLHRSPEGFTALLGDRDVPRWCTAPFPWHHGGVSEGECMRRSKVARCTWWSALFGWAGMRLLLVIRRLQMR